eukprot:Gregarina_sp_Poly_1__836@NODE_11_length_23386_cov_122_075861_g9_i0_p2_GENE_NODE_11_length_23386_cov_122_075861_g9_i0NODE_11_length_23386_cov_122_075861_g9_i0_p2_ORF_typecomplete_len1414_score170_58Pkinase/PF00069_25/4_1e73Pkinase/PF00069_25/6_4e03Pkinase_Tyr/PF07714_17/1_1e52Kinaselike/PF14531_6/5_1e17Kdo/PF06293_14/1_2e12Pkinase_fungal/PF17667_1/9_5e10RIO1/PF01163_22/4_3e09WaaY/PF06176_11/2_1e07APH/PF01636_23/3_3e06Haspin_kinase/PF12330_8/0_0015YrbLPhoP_reg/PF10707_9/0_0018Seadorna_VP7/PF07387_
MMPPRTLPFDFADQGYDLLKEIGSGQFGRVYLVTRFSDGEQLIAKIVDLSNLERGDKERAAQEVNVMQQLTHPHIVKCWDAFLYRNTYLVIIMEYCQGGDMAALLNNMRATNMRFSEREICEALYQLASAIGFIHSHRILHRDLKPSNILIDRDGRLKIADFGVSKRVDNTAAAAQTSVGTPQYTPPEMVMTQFYTSQCDMWALGCVVHEMMALQPAFQGESVLALAWKICFDAPAELPDIYSKKLRDLITALLHKDSSHRPSAVDILESECMSALSVSPDSFTTPAYIKRASFPEAPSTPAHGVVASEENDIGNEEPNTRITPLSPQSTALSLRELQPRPSRVRQLSLCKSTPTEECSFSQILLRRLTLAAEACDKHLVVLFASSHPEWGPLKLAECRKLRSLGRPEQVRELEAVMLSSNRSTLLEQIREALTQESLSVLRNRPENEVPICGYSAGSLTDNSETRINNLLDQDLAMTWVEATAADHNLGISESEMEFLLYCIKREEVHTDRATTLRDLCNLASLGVLPNLQARAASTAKLISSCYLSGDAGDIAAFAEFADAREATRNHFAAVAAVLIQGYDDKGEPITPGSFENALRHFGKGSNEDEIIVPPSEWQNVVRAHFQLSGEQPKLLYQVPAKTWDSQIQWKRTIKDLTRVLRGATMDLSATPCAVSSPLTRASDSLTCTKPTLRDSPKCVLASRSLAVFSKGPSPSSASMTTAPRSVTPDKKSLQETTSMQEDSSLQDTSANASPGLAAQESSPNSRRSHISRSKILELSPSFYTPHTPRTPTSTQSAADDYTPQSSFSDNKRLPESARASYLGEFQVPRTRKHTLVPRRSEPGIEDFYHAPRCRSRRRLQKHLDYQVDEAFSGMDRLYERQRQSPRPHAPLGTCKMRPVSPSELEVASYNVRSPQRQPHRNFLFIIKTPFPKQRPFLCNLLILGLCTLERVIEMLLKIIDQSQKVDTHEVMQQVNACLSNFNELRNFCSQCQEPRSHGLQRSESVEFGINLIWLANRVRHRLSALGQECRDYRCSTGGSMGFFTFTSGCNTHIMDLCGFSRDLMQELGQISSNFIEDLVAHHQELRYSAVLGMLQADQRSRPSLNRMRSDMGTSNKLSSKKGEEHFFTAVYSTHVIKDWCIAASHYAYDNLSDPTGGGPYGSVNEALSDEDSIGPYRKPFMSSGALPGRRFVDRYPVASSENARYPESTRYSESARYDHFNYYTNGDGPPSTRFVLDRITDRERLADRIGERDKTRFLPSWQRFDSESPVEIGGGQFSSRVGHHDVLETSPRSDGPQQRRPHFLDNGGLTSQVLTVDSMSRRGPLPRTHSQAQGNAETTLAGWPTGSFRTSNSAYYTPQTMMVPSKRSRYSSSTDRRPAMRHMTHRETETPSSRSSRVSSTDEEYYYSSYPHP